ncbi:hypothetical protein HAX54_025974 [Datura stramonium]|uniref:DNA-directed RNA polymerase n=1 Tax=Datura stramonium TaxID=4076 RepID=A0ABS8V0S3_DATST|nr:hypothetical protein [Datura stramonium]
MDVFAQLTHLKESMLTYWILSNSCEDWSLGISIKLFYEISERSTGVRMLYLSPGRDEYYYGSGRKFLSLKSGYSGRTGCSSSIPSRILDYCMGTEMLTYKSDHIRARQEVLGTTIIGGTIPNPEDAPESFRLLVRELRSLALELNHFLVSEKNFQINRKEA